MMAACGGGGGSSTNSGADTGGAGEQSAGTTLDTPGQAPTVPPISSPNASETEVGIGIYDLSYYDQSFAMVDVVRQAQFRAMDWSYDVGADENGAPTKDFRLVVSAKAYGAGTYKLRFKGQANISNAQNKQYNPATNVTTADLVYATPALGNHWIEFTNTRRTPASTTSDGVTEIQLWRPGYPTDGSVTFTSEFITAMRKFNVIRTMDFTKANTNPTATWSERTKPNFLGMTGDKGQSWEIVVMLANATGRDIWINVPVKADDAYIRKLAQLIKYGSDGNEPYTAPQANPKYPPLRSDLRIYVEYGNELWNFRAGFMGFYWARDFADANRLNPNHPIAFDGPVTDQNVGLRRWIAYRSAYISQAFRNEFGDAAMMTRVRPILASQIGTANAYLSIGLRWAEGFHQDTTKLWYGGGGAAYYDSTTAPTDLTEATMASYFAGLPTADFGTKVARDAIWTKGFGLKTIAYEGGPTPGGSATGQITGSDQLVYTYNADPRMKDAMINAHNMWLANGGDMLVYYVYSAAGPWSFSNGLLNSTVSDTTSVKLQAIDAIRTTVRTKPTLGTSIPGTVYLRSPTAQVIDEAAGGTQWGYGGTAYRIRPDATDPNSGKPLKEFLLVPTYTEEPGSYNVAITTYDAAQGSAVDLFANGKLVGELKPNVGPAGQAAISATIPVELGSGVTVFRLRAKTGSVWIKDLVVTK